MLTLIPKIWNEIQWFELKAINYLRYLFNSFTIFETWCSIVERSETSFFNSSFLEFTCFWKNATCLWSFQWPAAKSLLELKSFWIFCSSPITDLNSFPIIQWNEPNVKHSALSYIINFTKLKLYGRSNYIDLYYFIALS